MSASVLLRACRRWNAIAAHITQVLPFAACGVAVTCFACLQATDAVSRLPQLQAEYAQLESRYAAAVELLGERDEQLEEMAADLMDIKHMYKQQIEALVVQLAAAGSPAPAAPDS